MRSSSVALLVLVAILGLVSLTSGAPTAAALQPTQLPSRLQQSTAAGASTSIRAAAAAKQQMKRSGSKLGTYYHSTREIYDSIKNIAKTCTYLTYDWARAPASVDGGVKSLMTVRINFQPDQFPKKAERALFFFGEHAREMISPETGLEFIRRACDPAQLDIQYKDVGASLRSILQTTEFLIFPNANPAGRRITERGAYCNRVNDRGVDLNRNWGEHFSLESNHPDTYPGTAAWSEPETVILAQAASTFLPTIFISVHSGSLNMLSPFAYKGTIAGEPAASTTAVDPPINVQTVPADKLVGTGIQPVLKVLNKVNKDFCRCRVGAAGKELGYTAPGTCLDYIYNKIGTRYSFAVEIYSGTRYADRRGAAPSSLLQESMTMDEMSTLDEQEMEEEAALLAQSGEDEESHNLMELESEFFTRTPVDSLPSYDLPSFTETGSTVVHTVNDGDVPESSSILFPRTQRGPTRKCLSGFNPVTHPMYRKTVDHWSRALLAFVHTIHETRPQEELANQKV